jgi:epoxyqueuosine reductase QueG
MRDAIKNRVIELGADVCGIANIDRFKDAPKGFHPTDIYPDCKSVIVYGVALPKGLTKAAPIIYGHFNYDICKRIDALSLQTAKEIEKDYKGFAVPMPCDGPYEYWDSEKKEGRGLISMKHAAVLAGLGQLGKNTLLLNPKYGNLLILGVVLTNLELPSDAFAENICINSCSLCLDNCPSQALDGTQAIQLRCRPNTYRTNARGYEVVDCNKCRAICPMKFGKDNK